MHRDHRICGKYQLSAWPREADESEASQDCGEPKPAYDLDRHDHMAVQRRGIHRAVADRRHWLDAEEKDVREAVRPGIRDRARDQPVKCGEDDIHYQIQAKPRGIAARSARRQCGTGRADRSARYPAFGTRRSLGEPAPRLRRARARSERENRGQPSGGRPLSVVSSGPTLPRPPTHPLDTNRMSGRASATHRRGPSPNPACSSAESATKMHLPGSPARRRSRRYTLPKFILHPAEQVQSLGDDFLDRLPCFPKKLIGDKVVRLRCKRGLQSPAPCQA